MVTSKLTTSDPREYLQIVKSELHDERDTYCHFLQVLKAFRSKRIDINGLILRVKELFKRHKKLLLGFNAFLPKNYKINLVDMKPKTYEEAIVFINKIKTQFQDDNRVYESFLLILNMVKKGEKKVAEVSRAGHFLLRNHRDLLREFYYSLPLGENGV